MISTQMTNFTVLHITKYKQLDRIGNHIDRKHITTNVEPEKTDFNQELTQTLGKSIDLSKTHLREELSEHAHESLRQAVEKRIAQGYTKQRAIRKDTVRALGVILTGSHERIKEIEADKKLFEQWKKANYLFASREFGQQNIVRFTLHRDERTPHFHCVFVPLKNDGALSARHFINGSAKLRAYQDRYAAAMARFGLKRGIPVELTGRVHTSTKEHTRKVNQIAREAEEVTQNINIKNALQLNTVRKKTADYITQVKVEAVENEIKYRYAMKTNQTFSEATQRQAYKRILEEETKQSLSWIKQEIPLIDFAVSRLAWEIDKHKHKSTKRDVVLVHPKHGKIIVPTKPKSETGHWVYSWIDKKGGGTLIDLLVEEGWSWKDIKGLSSSYILAPVAELPPQCAAVSSLPLIEDPKKQEALAANQFNAIQNTPGETYLTRRGIASTTYESFTELRANNQQAVFGLYKDFDKEGQGSLCSTITTIGIEKEIVKSTFKKTYPEVWLY